MQPERDDTDLLGLMGSTVDSEWYKQRYPDVVVANQDPVQHFIQLGAAENRDPNRFFDSAWYLEHYPDVASSGFNPLMHYLAAGAPEQRNPHPRFDARYYVQQHPEAAGNPLLYHLRIGLGCGYLTEDPIDIREYLPVENPPVLLRCPVLADVIIPVCYGSADTRRCLLSVLGDRTHPLGRVTVIDDASAEPGLSAWLRKLAAAGQIHLIRNRRRQGFAACAALAIEASETDVVLLRSDTEVSAGWLHRLSTAAWSHPRIATVSALSNSITTADGLAIGGNTPPFEQTPAAIDEICRTVNAGRSVAIQFTLGVCTYVRRDALRSVGAFIDSSGSEVDFCLRAAAIEWQHRLACDTFVYHKGLNDSEKPDPDLIAPNRPGHASLVAQRTALRAAAPYRFAITAALCRRSALPVILMVSHDYGGGIRRHIESLAERYRGRAHVFLLEGTDRGAALSVLGAAHHPVLKLPSDRIDDMVLILRSSNLSRVHIHHQLHMDTDMRRLIHRLGIPFDLTVHDYFAICPQVNLLRWPEGIYCGEPGPASCNACIADLRSHGAKDIVSWRREKAWQFIEAERVICPSADVKSRLARYGIDENCIVVPHEAIEPEDWPISLPEHSGPPLRIVLLGVLASHKGARTVAAVAEAAAPGTIEIHLVGHLEASFPEPAVKLIKATGRYREADLDALVRGIKPHVFWFPSSAAETYSYTLSTAIASGLPIVATKLGSFPERLSGRPNTWLVDHRATTAEYLAVFEEVQTRLHAPGPQPCVPRPAVKPDFYDNHYLVPAGAPRRTERAGRKPRILILPERQENGSPSPCAYIRLLQPLDHPAIGGSFEIVLTDPELVFDYETDIIVTHQHAVPDVETADRLAAHARRVGATLLFDLDDDLLSVPPNHPDADQLRLRTKVVRRMLAVADAVWVSTQGLAGRLSALRPDATVIENRLDERIWFSPQVQMPAWDDPIRILCMGTTTHERDFALIEPVLARLKTEYAERIVIDVLGTTRPRDLAPGLNQIGPSPHATRSYPGFVNWLNRMQPAWHIGLAPLQDTPFNRCKSPIGAMDYAALGLATLASDTPAYRGSIADGPAGQLVTNDPVAWHAALDWLIRDQALRRSIAGQARLAFAERGTLLSEAERRRAAWTSLLPAARTRLRRGSPALTISDGQSHPTTRTSRHRGRGR